MATLLQAGMSYGILHVSMVQTDRRYLRSDREQVKQLLIGLPAIVNLLVGVGLLARKRWARSLGIVVCCLHVLAALIGTLIGTISVFALAGNIFRFLTPNTVISGSSTITVLLLLSRFGGSLHHLWSYAFVGCLLRNDRSLKRYIFSNIKQT
jgi:hypothetical protein